MRYSLIFPLAAAILPAFAAPTKTLAERATTQCGQWDSIVTGTYTLYQDLWGESAATSGSQCSQVNSLSGSTLAWSTSWSWAGGPYNVKSYANAVVKLTSKPLSQYKSMATTWKWTYTGSNIIADVAYDSFLGTSATASAKYEVMVWLGALGGAGPISSTGAPIATPTIGGTSFNLYSGPNGAMTVYSFVATSKSVTNYSGDLLAFYKYLETSYGVSSSLYLQSVGAGTEPFTGSNAVLTTSAYSLVIS